MDRLEVDWALTLTFPGGPTASGWVPPVGVHVHCYRPTDGKTHCGTVDDNRCGLFLTRCDGSRVVLTAARWVVTPLAPTASCRAA